MYIWGMMDKFWYQGTESANAAINFTVPLTDRVHLFINESNHLGVVTWPYHRHIGNEPWNVPASTIVEREYINKIMIFTLEYCGKTLVIDKK